jgi:hypothetical protein
MHRRLATLPTSRRVERAIERREIVMTMDEQCSTRMVDVVAPPQIDQLQRLNHVEHASGVHVEAQAMQQPPEHEKVGEKGAPAVRHARFPWVTAR